MKKLFSLFLVVVIMLSGCSSGAQAISYEEEDKQFDAACALIDEGKYEEAIAILSDIESYKRYRRIEDKISEANALLIEAESASTPVPITMENWEKYFEQGSIEAWRVNAFGETDGLSILYYVKLRDIFKDAIDVTKSNIAVGFHYDVTSYDVDIDFEKHNYELLKRTGDWHYDDIVTLKRGDNLPYSFGEAVFPETSDWEYWARLYCCKYSINALDSRSQITTYPYNLEIKRISGDLYVYDSVDIETILAESETDSFSSTALEADMDSSDGEFPERDIEAVAENTEPVPASQDTADITSEVASSITMPFTFSAPKVLETSEESEPLHFATETAVIDYNSYEYVSKGYFGSAGGDPSKTICLNFDYTNKAGEARNYSNDFSITAFQNGVELSGTGSYSPSGAPASVSNAYTQVMKDGTVTVGKVFVLQDYSPLTVSVRQNFGFGDPVLMELSIDPYVDRSFDLNRIYGLWRADKGGGYEVKISSSRIWYGDSSTTTYQDNPSFWTDENSFHTSFAKLSPSLQLEESDGKLRMYNDKISLVQVENWPEEENNELPSPVLIDIGSPIITDFAKISFSKSDFSKELSFTTDLAKNTSGGTGGNIKKTIIIESEKAGTQYLYLQGSVENLYTSSIEPASMRTKLIINEEYELNCKISLLSGGSTIRKLDPLNSATIIIDTPISNDIAKSITSAVLHIGFDNLFFGSASGDPSECQYQYDIKLK